MKQILLTALVLLFGMTGFAQEGNYWSSMERGSVDFEGEEVPKEFEAFELDLERLKEDLGKIILASELNIVLPIGNGAFETFKVSKRNFFDKSMEDKYQAIRTYKGYSKSGIKIYFSITPLLGFHAAIKNKSSLSFIDFVNDNTYILYESKHLITESFICGFDGGKIESFQELELNTNSQRSAPNVNLRTYRLALACTGEFGASRGGGTKSGVNSIYTATFDVINLIYENEFNITFTLIPNNDTLVFLNSTTDPYIVPTEDIGTTILQQNTNRITNLITTNAFDIGHVFHIRCDDVGGVAFGSSVCNNNIKGAGVTCWSNLNINQIATQVMAHEIGHQFSAGHTWHSCTQASSGQRAPSSAFEPGSGTTIMSYAGACQTNNIPGGRTDPYFHVGSLVQVTNFSRNGQGSLCGTSEPRNNSAPEVSLPYINGFYIPKSTPFRLEANVADQEGDEFTYCWEQYDRDGRESALGAPTGNAPIFRTFEADTFPDRIFPRLFRILTGTSNIDEILPTYGRDLTFRCTARDNNPDLSGVSWEEVSFHVDGDAGPFQINNLQARDTFQQSNFIPVLWDVANTDGNLINCQKIDVLLSTDGGATFPYTLLSETPNDGFAYAKLPEFIDDQIECRIQIRASNNIFFDINSTDFIISNSTSPNFSLGLEPNISTVCYPEFNLMLFDIASIGVEGFSEEVNLTIEGLPAGAASTFSKNPIQPGDTSIVTVDLNGITDLGIFNVKVVGNSNSIQNFERSTEIKILSTDFSTLNLNDPPNGASGISFGPRLEWVDVPDALLYDVEISDDPTFQSNVQTRSNTTINFYNPLQSLSPNTTYYWRVKPKNDCTDGQFTAPNAFRTGTFACTEYEAQDVPIFISGSGTPTRTSTISISESGSIEDVNLKNIKGDHEIFSDLEFSLTSPTGTEVLLFSNKCGNVGATFDFNLDDEASIAFNCSALGLGWDHRPDSSLAKFIGEDTQGDWVLTMKDLRATASGGVDSWTVEFCAPLSTEKPNLATNLIFPVQKNGTRRISNEFLNITDNNFGASELEYTLVVNTQEGSLFLNNNPINVGQTFTQSDIDNGNLKYGHNGGDIDNDYFTFVVVNPDGGFFGTPNFEISIAEDVSTSTEEIASSDLIILYPNPARDLINLRFEEVKQEDIEVSIYNIQGKTLYQSILPANREIQIPTRGFASGIYIAKVRRGDEIIVKRFEIIN